MVSHLFFYQLTLIALVWLCVILQWAWPSDPATVCPTTPEPPGPRPKRRHEPKPFAGLTQKPHCALCEQETDETAPASPQRPDPMPPTNRRPRMVDTSMHFCPHTGCDDRGWLGLGNLRVTGCEFCKWL
jgi:hypothetical protein